MGFKNITEADVCGKKVLVRVDYNVPIKNGKVVASEKIAASVETIKYLLSQGATIVLCSHLGNPGGNCSTKLTTGKRKEFSLKLVVKELENLIRNKVIFISDCIGPERDQAVQKAKGGDVILLENVRFYKGEEENDSEFSKKLAKGCDLFVNDAFSESHRAYASIIGVPKILDSYAGIHLKEEVKLLTDVFDNPKKPFIAVIGGAKISSKIDILKALAGKVDVLILGGGMANTFLLAEGYDMGKSLVEEECIDSADEIKREAEDFGVELLLPDDVMTVKNITDSAKPIAKPIDEIEKSDIVVDIGSRTIAKFSEPLNFAGTIFWNGPVGIAEHKNFAGGTKAIAAIISESGAKSVIGGGDTIAVLGGQSYKFSFVSTGGGATLAFVAGEKLPGLEAIERAKGS